MGKWSIQVAARVGWLLGGFFKARWHLLLAWPACMTSGCGWIYSAVVALGLPVLMGFWFKSSIESSDADTVSASGRMTAGAFFGLKPAALSNSGSMVSEDFATLLILPAISCTESSSSLSLLANSSFFLVQPRYLRTRASSESSGHGCLVLTLAVEAETLALRDTVRSSEWAVTCSAKGRGISSLLLQSCSEQSSPHWSVRGTGSYGLGPEAAIIHLKWAWCTCKWSVTIS